MSADFVPLNEYREFTDAEMLDRSQDFYNSVRSRRTVRDYSNRRVSRKVIDQCLLSAGTSPSGANMQPWHFAVMELGDIRSRLRYEAEKEEKEFYDSRATDEWLEALAPLGTNSDKPFLSQALILGSTFLVLALVSVIFYSILASFTGQQLRLSLIHTWTNRIGGGFLIGAGIMLAFK